MHAPRLVTATLVASGLSLLGAAPAQAGQVNRPVFREAFDDVACDIAVHVDVFAANPIVETGRLTDAGYPDSVDTGHLQVRLTNPTNGHWMEDDFSGPAMVVSAVVNPDGSQSKRVVFDGTKRVFKAWDGTVVADRGRLVVDYVISADDEIVSRTLVSQVGDFPIASGDVGFCDFAQEHLA
jgi:hypothetical protein